MFRITWMVSLNRTLISPMYNYIIDIKFHKHAKT